MHFLKFATEHEFAFEALGILLTAISASFLTLSLPTSHSDETRLGDCGVGLAAAFVKKHGWTLTVFGYSICMLGVALFFLPTLGFSR